MFDKMKGLMEMRKKLEEIKKELDKTNFEIESPGGAVKIIMNGSQEVQEVVFSAVSLDGQKDRLQKDIKDTFNRAVKRSQEIAAKKMREATGIRAAFMVSAPLQ